MDIVKKPVSEAATKLTDGLLSHLKNGQRVLWFISGGSNIAVACNIMQKLIGHEERLTITLIDERYGVIGHPDSNWQQLLDAGFKGGKAVLFPVLQDGLSLAATARNFELTLQDCFANCDLSVALLGMGPDGHTAGILPNSPATTDTDVLATSYQTSEYDRVTMTFAALKKLDLGYCLAYGDNKKNALKNLLIDAPLIEQPAQIFKQMQRVYVYNDQVTEITGDFR